MPSDYNVIFRIVTFLLFKDIETLGQRLVTKSPMVQRSPFTIAEHPVKSCITSWRNLTVREISMAQ